MKRSVRTSIFLFCAALAVVAASTGCGGAIDFNAWAGSYTGTGELDNHKAGALSLVCGSDGLVSGSLDVTGVNGTDTNFKFTPGSYTLAGSITSTSGNFEVHGNVPSNGDFFIRGRFPTNATPLPYTVTTAASAAFPTVLTFTGTLSRS